MLNHLRLKASVGDSRSGIDDAGAHTEKAQGPSVCHLLRDDAGQDLIEYAMVAALVGLGALAAMKGLKNSIGNSFNGVGTSLSNA